MAVSQSRTSPAVQLNMKTPAQTGGFFVWYLLRSENFTPGRGDSMGEFRFEPIKINASAPGGERVVRTFDDIAAFADALDTPQRQSTRWQAVSANAPQARFGARRTEA